MGLALTPGGSKVLEPRRFRGAEGRVPVHMRKE